MNAPFRHDNRVKVDTVIAIGLYFLSAISMVLWQMTGLFNDPLSMGWSLLLLALVILPLGLRRVVPCSVAAFVTVAFCIATAFAVSESSIITVALFLALYSVGAETTDRTRASWVQGVLVAVLLSVTIISLYMVSTNESIAADFGGDMQGWALSPLVAYSLVIILINVVYYAAAIWFGNRAWASKQDREQLVNLTKALANQQLQSERQAVTIERMRIARELHDAVAHHLQSWVCKHRRRDSTSIRI